MDFGLAEAISLKKRVCNPVIAEIKVFSPRHGDLLGGRDPLDILRAYERAGATGISYITEQKHFRGNFEVFRRLCKESELPVLRKDFIKNKEEIERTAEAGAAALLLIVRILGEKICEFVDFALEHGMDTIVEVHSRDELEIALTTNSRIVGINNRDIGRLEKDDGDVSVTKDLAPSIPEKFLKVSESGISGIDDLRTALRYADAVLVGTAFMRVKNPKNIEKIVGRFVKGGVDD